jgi:hypothetical protein
MPESGTLPATKRRIFWIPLLAIVLTWTVLYLPHLRTSPRWYGDETLTLMIGKSLFAGAPADRSLKISFWHPSYTYQPGYAWVAGMMAAITGGDILGARFLNVSLALTIALVLFIFGRKHLGYWPALFAALLFLTYDQTVIHFRWIYPHNAVALGFLISVLALMRASSPRADWTTGAGLGLAAFCHPLFAHGAIAAWLCRLKRPRAWIRMAILPGLVLAASFLSAIWRYQESWLWGDLSELLAFYRVSSSEAGTGAQPFLNFYYFFRQDFFHIGVLLGGLLCLTRRRLYPIGLFLLVVSALLLQNRRNIPLFYYQAVTLLPIMALAWAGGLRVVLMWIWKVSGRSRLARLLAILVLILPAIYFLKILPAAVSGKLVSRNDIWVTQNTDEVTQAADWLKARLHPDDLVICGTNIGWMLPCRQADLIQATTWAGHKSFTFETPIAHKKFLHPADLSQARYVIISDLDQRWTFGQTNVSLIANLLEKEKWQIVWQGPFYIIVENPRLTPSPTPSR